MHLECKYYQQIVKSFIDMQSTQRLPLESIREWAIKNRNAIYIVKNFVEFGLVPPVYIMINNEERKICNLYRKLNIHIGHIEEFYQIYKQRDYALLALEELKACKGEKDLVFKWLIRHYKLYDACFLFLLSNSYNAGDIPEGTQYVFSSEYYEFAIGFETEPFIPVENFTNAYCELLNFYDLWVTINDMYEEKRKEIVNISWDC